VGVREGVAPPEAVARPFCIVTVTGPEAMKIVKEPAAEHAVIVQFVTNDEYAKVTVSPAPTHPPIVTSR
jgi:hypothetical protein